MGTTEDVRSVMIDIDALPWNELLPGVLAKRVWADPDTKRAAMFIRFAPGASLARHVHAGDELLYVLEGSVADEHAVVTAGTVGYRPDGCTHTVSSPNGATVFAVVTGAIKPVSSDDASGPPTVVFDIAAMSWTEGRPGILQKRFFIDEAANRVGILSRFGPGGELPAHRHRGDELVFVIEGTVEDEAGTLRPGMLGYRPDGCAHTVRTPNGATVLNLLWGDVEAI